MELRPEEISRIIRSQIKHYEAKINQSETGTVILIGDGIAKAAGLTGCMVNELLEFPGGVYGMAQNRPCRLRPRRLRAHRTRR